ncbi:MAG: hypothetical protein N3A02_05940, partial [Rectinema sp.]|nr:hypothetical protein [Rectinema sp.]
MQVSLMSQRLDILAEHPTLVALEAAAGKRSFTLGIEGISSRMRAYYHKGITEQHIHESVSHILSVEPRELKLFFIISGFENDHDIAEFHELCQAIHDQLEKTHRPVRVIASAGFLVRLPFTPLQYAPLMKSKTLLSRIASRMESCCRKAGFEFRLASPYGDYWADQLLSMAGSSAHDWLVKTPTQHFLYDGTLAREASESLDAFLSAQPGYNTLFEEKSPVFKPEFSFIEPDSHWALLRAHYEQAKASLERQDADSHDRMNSKKTSHIMKTVADDEIRAAAVRMQAMQKEKASFPFRIVLITESPDLAWATEAYRRASLLRSLARLVPGAEKAVFLCRELAVPNEWGKTFSDAGRMFGLYGMRWYALYGPHEAALEKAISLASAALRSSPKGPNRIIPLLDIEMYHGNRIDFL